MNYDYLKFVNENFMLRIWLKLNQRLNKILLRLTVLSAYSVLCKITKMALLNMYLTIGGVK